jgi:hypothetical protein
VPKPLEVVEKVGFEGGKVADFSLSESSYVLISTQIKRRRSHPRPQTPQKQFRALARFLPMVTGSLVEQYVSCGKPRCRCQRGQKHGPLHYLYWKEQGRSRSLYVPREHVKELRRQIQNYRRFQTELTSLLRRQRQAWRRRFQEERQR